jgi:CheY-like chemotaxis protein
VVWNLLSNAVKFTDDGGSVTVTLEAHVGSARLTVSDTGQGIASAFLSQVFERFKQADPSASRRHGGLGLGLALVKELVELHGGTVSVESAGRGHGTTFAVSLPGREAVVLPAAPPRPLPAAAALRLNGVHVLVVEDDPDALEIATRTLADAGATVRAAISVPDAIEVLRASGGESLPDVIVSDVGMPHSDGFALLEALQQQPPQYGGRVPAIAVTAYATSEDRARALKAGFQAHLAKPFVSRVLIETILRVVAAARG